MPAADSVPPIPTPGSNAWLTPLSRRAIICTIAGTCGYLLASINIPVFGGTSLVFGGIFPMLMAVAYGPWWGLLTAVGTYLETLGDWNHPYGLLVFSLEAWTIGWLMHRRGQTLFRATLTFWAVLGLPVTAICIFGLLRPPFPHNWAMAIKYLVNGLLVYVVVQFLVFTRSFLKLPVRPQLAEREESLQTNLSRRLMILAVLPAAVFAVGAAYIVNRQHRNDVRVNLAREANWTSEVVATYVANHVQAIESSAAALEGRPQNPSSLDSLLKRIAANNSGFITMLVADEQGRVIAPQQPTAANGRPVSLMMVADRDYYLHPQLGGRAFVSPVFRGRGFGHDLIVAISAAYATAEGHRTVIEGSLHLNRMRDLVLRNSELQQREILVLDGRSRVIFRQGFGENFDSSDLYRLPARDLLDELLPDDAIDPRTGTYQRYLGIWHTVPSLGWNIYLREEVWTSEAPVARFLLLEGIALLGALALAFLIARSTSEHFTQPVQDIVGYAHALVLRRNPLPLILPHGLLPTEWRSLALDLRNAAASLAQTNAELESAVAERELSNAKLRSLTSELDERVRERTQELETARQLAERANRAKTEFLASVSHELRTPLNVTLGNIHLLERSATDPLSPAQAARIVRIKASADHLLVLINDILDLAKLEADKIELEVGPVEVAQLIRDCEDFFKEECARVRLTLSVNLALGSTKLVADKRRLRQILYNLLSNAVKFTPEGGAIGIDVATRGEGTSMSFTVWDTGIGITAAEQERLFRPFEQIDSRLARRYPGTGLGLSIVKRLAALHGGTVSVTSTPGAGSRFTVELPATPLGIDPVTFPHA